LEVACAFVWAEPVEEITEAPPGRLERALGGLAHEVLDLGEDLLDGVEVG
jgi:hypothetical protein